MGQLSGKIIKASPTKSKSAANQIGPALKRLRVLADLTQSELAKRLSVQQSAISKIENGDDAHLSTIQKYIEALGATLRVDAAFPVDTPFMIQLLEAFDIEYGNDDQLVLPLLGDEPFRSQRDVVLSIKPQYSEKIIAGSKTVELRRRFPVSAPNGTLAYIYSTSPIRAMVGVAEIKDVLKLRVEHIWAEYEKSAFIKQADFEKYFEGLDFGVVVIFDDARAFERAIPLDELREKFGFEPPQSFLYAKRDLRKALKHEYTIVSH
jgi:predicted transcriptional regulator/DNA-binding XRE family transcriptional regulator